MTNNVYIGWDDREITAYNVCSYSMKRRTKSSVNIIPLKHRELRRQGFFRRPWLTESNTGHRIDLIDGKKFSTEFSHTRFLVPALQKHKGWALFMDCDMICQDDINKVFDLADNKYAVMVVKHNHNPKETTKMDDQPQCNYFRKNWSSFVLWNCEHPANREITASRVNLMSGRDLHTFSWLPDNLIGHLGFEYNWIEGNSPAMEKPKVIHYTLGGPWFDEWQDVMYADNWLKEYEEMMRFEEGMISDIPSIGK